VDWENSFFTDEDDMTFDDSYDCDESCQEIVAEIELELDILKPCD